MNEPHNKPGSIPLFGPDEAEWAALTAPILPDEAKATREVAEWAKTLPEVPWIPPVWWDDLLGRLNTVLATGRRTFTWQELFQGLSAYAIYDDQAESHLVDEAQRTGWHVKLTQDGFELGKCFPVSDQDSKTLQRMALRYLVRVGGHPDPGQDNAAGRDTGEYEEVGLIIGQIDKIDRDTAFGYGAAVIVFVCAISTGWLWLMWVAIALAGCFFVYWAAHPVWRWSVLKSETAALSHILRQPVKISTILWPVTGNQVCILYTPAGKPDEPEQAVKIDFYTRQAWLVDEI